MQTIYQRLAAKLDQLPSGFPRTESAIELRILARIFSPEDAAMAVSLLPVPETVEGIGSRLGRPATDLRIILDAMVERGQIGSMMMRGKKLYMLAPFVVGIYEFQLPRMDAELAAMFEEYAPHLLPAVGGHKPALARVVPVNLPIDAHAEVLAYEDMRRMLSSARSFNLQPCICRTEQAALGKPCSHPVETCMAFSSQENAYDGTLPAGYGRRVSREEALAVLDLAEREGLVHCTYNVKRDQMFVCNCCSCCCGFLRGVTEFGAPHLLVRSNWVSAIDADACSGCGECAAPRCPMDAIAEEGGNYAVDAERCIGCGVCTVVCPTNAISLRPRPRSERTKPAKTIVSWAFHRTVSRRGMPRAAAQFGSLTLQAMRPRLATRRSKSAKSVDS
ncbi:MAG: ATP-binding protein [Thermoanaerobaculales bacterium]